MIKEKLLVATTNQGKAKEIQNYLSSLNLQVNTLSDVDIQDTFPEEKTTFRENARGKSLFYSQFWTGLVLAEDSGLEIEHLDGAPGVLSARFSDPQATDQKNIQKVLALMEGVPPQKRKARFVSCLVLSRKGNILREIQESVEGFITTQKKGQHGFGYDPIFYYPPLKKTFAQLLPEEKNRVSHRGRSLKKLKTFLAGHLNNISSL
ncbi:MAG: RdgB/HAM1 family non-canonical purine NTP pyrophosphatase [Candidatus Aminicenantes bacterium]